MDHTDLWSVTVCDHNLIIFTDKSATAFAVRFVASFCSGSVVPNASCPRAITIFCSPRMPTTNAWVSFMAITCFPGNDVSCHTGIRRLPDRKGEMQATDLAMYALYIGIFISPIQILVELTEMIQKASPDSNGSLP